MQIADHAKSEWILHMKFCVGCLWHFVVDIRFVLFSCCLIKLLDLKRMKMSYSVSKSHTAPVEDLEKSLIGDGVQMG